MIAAFILGAFCGVLAGVAVMALMQINHIDRQQGRG